MANAKISVLGAQCTTNAAAVATALGGGVVTSDVQALGTILTNCALRPDIMYRMIQMTNGPGGTTLANQLTPG